MKKQIILSLTLTFISTSLLAAGSHSGEHNMNSMGAHWASPKEAAKLINPIASNALSIAQGSVIYQKNCASCHGKTAQGDGLSAVYLNPKPTNLKAMSGAHPDSDFAWKISNGRGAMPAWKGILSSNEIWHTVNYIQSLKNTANSIDNKQESSGHHNHGKHH